MPRELAYLPVRRLLRFGRRLAPASVRARLRQLLFEWLDLSWQTPTGLTIRLANYSDWIVYNEIFVSGEYDRALAMALDSSPAGPIRIVDLGANTGFFTLRAVDALRGRGRDDFAVTAIEAHPGFVRDCVFRLFEENGLSSHVRVVHGAIGRRTGMAVIHEAQLATGIIRDADGPHGGAERVPYVDLSPLVEGFAQIELLKCDIEGSEQAFIEQYPDVLRKTRVAVFEFHCDLCDVERCQALLREYGFTGNATLRPGAINFTYAVWR